MRLNWRLVMAPPELSDYVATHKACHLRVPDHLQAFWSLLAGLIPDCRARRRRLNQLVPGCVFSQGLGWGPAPEQLLQLLERQGLAEEEALHLVRNVGYSKNPAAPGSPRPRPPP